MSKTNLDRWAIRRFILAAAVVTAGFTLANLAFVAKEPSGPPLEVRSARREPPVHLGRETKRFLWHQVDLDEEANFSSWLSSAQLAIAGFLGLMLAWLRRRRGWLAIGLALLLLSSDEIAQFHEWIGVMMFRSDLRFGFIYPPYPWVLLLGPPLIAAAIYTMRFLLDEIRDDPGLRRIAVASLLLFMMVLPLEVLGGVFESRSAKLLRVESTLEETSELLGETLLIAGLLALLSRSLGRRLPRRPKAASQQALEGPSPS